MKAWPSVPTRTFSSLESVRLGIFERNDLILAEEGKEWLEISQVLLINEMRPDQQPEQIPVVTPRAIKDGNAWLEVSELLPLIKAPQDQPLPAKPRFKPLTEQQLRTHEMLSAPSPITAFITELIRGRFAFAAIPVGMLILGLLTSAAVLKHQAPSVLAQAHPGLSQQSRVVQAPGKIQFSAHQSFFVGSLRLPG